MSVAIEQDSKKVTLFGEFIMEALRFVLLICVAYSYAINSADSAGDREKTDVFTDICSTAFNEQEHITKSHFHDRVHDPNKHVAARLLRYFRLGGIVEAISEKTGIDRATLLKGGASQYQDKSSNMGFDYHAAHIIRVGAIDSKLEKESPSLHKKLKTFIGHTQNVAKIWNVWYGVGGEIDRYQSSNIGVLSTIVFKEDSLDPDDQRTVETLIHDFRRIIDKYIPAGTETDEFNKLLEKEKVLVYCVTTNMLHREGKQGYEMVTSGKFLE